MMAPGRAETKNMNKTPILHNLPTVETATTNERMLLAAIFRLCGYYPHADKTVMPQEVEATIAPVYPCWRTETKGYFGGYPTDSEAISIEQWLSLAFPSTTAIVKLNDKYTAKVSAEEIIVSCQTFTHETLDRLHEASVKLRAKQETTASPTNDVEWHNPANAPAPPKGYRFLTKKEAAVRSDMLDGTVDSSCWYDRTRNRWSDLVTTYFVNESSTLAVPAHLPLDHYENPNNE